MSRPGSYLPVDLGELCNVGSDLLGGPSILPGSRTYLGLPFLIAGGSSPETSRFILVEPGAEGILIPIDRPATRVILAHRRRADETDQVEVGEPAAIYRFELAGGAVEEVTIRERFEIGVIGGDDAWDRWDLPFLAIAAGDGPRFDRHRGEWGEAGYRQTEAPWRGFTSEFYLWTWESPEPGATLASIHVVSTGSRVLVGAVTVSTADEDPFLNDAVVPVRITVLPEGPAGDLDLEVDRGTSGYTYPLPDRPLDDYLADPMPGWGEPRPQQSAHAYNKVSALPSATLTVSTSGVEQGRVRWDKVQSGSGTDEAGKLRIEVVESGRNWVHVEVVDEETRRPIPCRVHFSSPEGIPYQPHGHHDHINSDLDTWHMDVGGDVRLGRLSYAYIDGTCQGWLPRGDVVVDVARGYEYQPIRETVRIEKGQRALTLLLKRWTDMNARGWYSGDSHVHFLSASGSLTEQQAENLNVVNLLQSQWGSLFTNTEDFTSRPHTSDDGRYVTYVSQENRQHFLGHLILWGLKQPVMPWCSDGPIEAEIGSSLEITESEWADQCHAQGGTVVIPHFPHPNGEPAVLIATGRADAVEMIMQRKRSHEEYYRYLNGGYRLPLVGGTDKMSSDVPVGLYRTYANLGDEEFTYEAWCEAVRSGRTFLSGGPILTFEVDGADIGNVVRLSSRGTVSVAADVECVFPVGSLEVLLNGEVVAATSEPRGSRSLRLTAEIEVGEDSWLAARCGGEDYFNGLSHHDVWNRGVFAHTSPVYVATGREWSRFDPGHARYMMTLVEGGLAYVQTRAARYPDGHATHHHGEEDHVAYLERPFREALDRLNRILDRRSI